jgi:hypothetical protein
MIITFGCCTVTGGHGGVLIMPTLYLFYVFNQTSHLAGPLGILALILVETERLTELFLVLYHEFTSLSHPFHLFVLLARRVSGSKLLGLLNTQSNRAYTFAHKLRHIRRSQQVQFAGYWLCFFYVMQLHALIQSANQLYK